MNRDDIAKYQLLKEKIEYNKKNKHLWVSKDTTITFGSIIYFGFTQNSYFPDKINIKIIGKGGGPSIGAGGAKGRFRSHVAPEELHGFNMTFEYLALVAMLRISFKDEIFGYHVGTFIGAGFGLGFGNGKAQFY